jgi:hypothetical protein
LQGSKSESHGLGHLDNQNRLASGQTEGQVLKRRRALIGSASEFGLVSDQGFKIPHATVQPAPVSMDGNGYSISARRLGGGTVSSSYHVMNNHKKKR